MKHPRLRAKIVPVPSLSAAQHERLYSLMGKYYEHVTREEFQQDLADKDDIILLLHPSEDLIEGFSTLKKLTRRTTSGKIIHSVFSGDTVVEKKYWGQRVLGQIFLRYLFMQKLKKPFSTLYWLLISKGYKTYLLMANNFPVHYPRFESETPAAVKALMDDLYGTMYPHKYDSTAGLIKPLDASCKVRGGIADVAPQLPRENPRVKFFLEKNPSWHDGVELCCVAEMTLTMPLFYFVKSFWKLHTPKPIATPATPPVATTP